MADVSRRQFFRLGPGKIVREADKEKRGDEVPAPIRPPGALKDREAFNSACERCGKCAEACPHDVIFKMGPAGGKEEGTPFLVPDVKPCHWCETMDCIVACPSGALVRVEGEKVEPIAKVGMDEGLCLNSQGTICDDCVHHCPRDVRAIKSRGRAVVLDEEACVGCGLCIYYCPARPVALGVISVGGE